MNSLLFANRPRALAGLSIRIFQAAALALILAIAMPARAGDDRAIKSRVAPIYPEMAKRMRIGGSVKLEASVDAQGRVTDVKAISGNRLLAVAAEDAVRKWQFVAGSADTSVTVEVNFAVSQ